MRILLSVYLAVLAVGVFGPEPGDELDAAAKQLRLFEEGVRDRVGGPSSTESAPSSTMAPPTATLAPPISARPVPASPVEAERDRWFDDLRAEPFFNVAVFVPLGLLFPLAWAGWRWLTVLLGAQLSGAVELVQDVLLGWRSPTIEDVRWNTLGTAIGFGVWLALRVAAPRAVDRLSASGPPGYSGNIPRRGSSVQVDSVPHDRLLMAAGRFSLPSHRRPAVSRRRRGGSPRARCGR